MKTIEELLTEAIELGASDLHLNPGRPPVVRLDGSLVSMGSEPLTPEHTEKLCRELCNDSHWAEMDSVGSTDLGLAHSSGTRFRVSCLRQKGRYASVLRLIPSELLSMDAIGLPDVVRDLLRRPRGLVLVTGPTGSGKTTTLAAMIDWINEHQDRHIITIEDPIEYYHDHKQGLVTQREVGEDVPDFSEAMRRALRQDPDVILLGEMRDLETISAAITAAETGHLVFGTLHTTGSARTVNRIIDAFPGNQQEQIRAQLSVSLVSVVSQVLMPHSSGKGRVAGFEVMVNTSAIANLIRKNETNKIPSSIQTSRRLGMITLDDYLYELCNEGKIDRQTAIDYAQDERDLEARL
ncbi:MAG: PilT/PilU family type 4a pilus ATPase [bacterium]|nr:PilT/PilU family type 4a pilus ATPase [bacterium]